MAEKDDKKTPEEELREEKEHAGSGQVPGPDHETLGTGDETAGFPPADAPEAWSREHEANVVHPTAEPGPGRGGVVPPPTGRTYSRGLIATAIAVIVILLLIWVFAA